MICGGLLYIFVVVSNNMVKVGLIFILFLGCFLSGSYIIVMGFLVLVFGDLV